MTYTYTITPELIVNVYINGQLVDYPGPWANYDEAQLWADDLIEALEGGQIIYPEQENQP